MQQQPSGPQQPSLWDEMRASVNIAYFIALAHATCITPFLRSGFGRNYFGVNGIAAFVLVLLAACCTHDFGMTVYFYAWLAALVRQRRKTVLSERQGTRQHSQYGGWPWVALLVPGVRTESAAKEFEPLLCGIIGLCLLPLSPGVGGFVLTGFLSLAIVHGMEQAAFRRQVTALCDIQIEQQILSDQLHQEEF